MAVSPPCRFPHRVTVEQATEEPNEFGDVIQTWNVSSLGERWAAVRGLTGKELERAQAVEATATTEVWLRFAKGLNPKMRLIFTNGGITRTLNIVYRVNWQERNKFLYLLCAEEIKQ